MVDINSSRQWLSMMRRTRAAIPDLIDQANESGDYSQVDQAHQVMDRLLSMGDQHVQAMKGAVNQDKAAGHPYAQNHPLADQTPEEQQQAASAAPGGNLPSIDPQTMGQPQHDGTPESTAHEAARGAAKGIIEAQQQAPGTYQVPSVDYFQNHAEPADTALPPASHYGPGELSFKADPGVERYAPGELSFKSDFAPWNIPPAKAQEPPPSALPPSGTDDEDLSGVGAGDLLERARKRKEDEFSDIDKALEQAKRIQTPKSALPDFSDIDTALEQAKRIQTPSSALPDLSESQEQGEPSEADTSEPGDFRSRTDKTLDEILDLAGEKSALPEPTPTEADEGADLEKYTPALTKQYGSNPKKLVDEFLRSPGLSDYDREFAHRVQVELGKRPQLATIPKILAALTLGVGSALGSWITGRYNGQALLDLSEDQKHYDAQKAQIGRETYLMNKKEGVQDTRQQNQMDRTQLQEQGKNARQQVGEAGKNARLETQEGGKNTRLATQETGRDTRQQKALDSHERIANIRAAAAKHGDQMSISDKAELSKLGKAYGGIDRTLMTVDPKVKAQGDDILTKMESIIDKYRAQGK